MERLKNNLGTWFLVYTKPNQESIAKVNLENQDFKTLMPIVHFVKEDDSKYQSREILFPRYLFVKIDIRSQDWTTIKSTRGVSHIVRFGNILAEVPHDLIDKLYDLTDDEGNLYQAIEDLPIQKGDEVFLKDGLFKDKKAIFIDYKGNNRAKILIDVINKKISVDILISSIARKIPKKKILPI